MRSIQFWSILLLAGVLLTGCSSTTLSGAWKNPGYNNKVKKVYIVGIASQETHRRIFATASGRPKGADKLKKLKSKDEKDERGWFARLFGRK